MLNHTHREEQTIVTVFAVLAYFCKLILLTIVLYCAMIAVYGLFTAQNNDSEDVLAVVSYPSTEVERKPCSLHFTNNRRFSFRSRATECLTSTRVAHFFIFRIHVGMIPAR